jgi:transketolase
LRSIPGMVVIRPADANETVGAWRIAIARRDGPVALVLTRQGLPVLDLARYPGIPAGVPLGGYVLADSPLGARPDVILIATGSEVHLALAACDRLATEGVGARVVSVPSTNIFAMQSESYRNQVLPPSVPLLVIEAGASLGWKSYVGPQIAVIGVDTFGASAPGSVVMQHYGFSTENVCKQAHNALRQFKSSKDLMACIASESEALE